MQAVSYTHLPRDTVTDSNGNFSFFHVEGGEHQIRILGSTGNVLGERKVNLFSAPPESGVNVSLRQDGQYTVEVAVDVRMMEVVIELDEENRSLYINPEKLTYLTSDGRVVTPTGEAYHWEGTIVTPGGVVITADGTVVAPASEGPLGIALLTPENQVVYPEQDTALPDGTQLLENGNILLPGETVIEKNETGTVILTPDGQRGQPGAGGVVISGDNQVSPIGAGTNVNGNSGGPDESALGNGYETGTDQTEQNDASQNGDGSGGGNAGPESEERGENSVGSGAGNSGAGQGNDNGSGAGGNENGSSDNGDGNGGDVYKRQGSIWIQSEQGGGQNLPATGTPPTAARWSWMRRSWFRCAPVPMRWTMWRQLRIGKPYPSTRHTSDPVPEAATTTLRRLLTG